MLHAKNVPGRFWAEAIRIASYVINRLPQQRLEFLSPFEKLWNMKANVSYLRAFGYVCYGFIPDYLCRKLDKKVVKCVFICYDNQRKVWKCSDPTTGRCYTSHHVEFDETSSWWSMKKKISPNQTDLKNKLQITYIRSNEDANVEQGRNS